MHTDLETKTEISGKVHFVFITLTDIDIIGDRVSSCNMYVVQQDTQIVSMSEFIQHLC